MTTSPATQRQLQVHAWMLEYFDVYCMWPTVREIAEAFSWKSTNAVVMHLEALHKKGLVLHRPRCARGWIAVRQ